MPTQLIVNADDFGASGAINSAIVQARQRGLLTSASLMVAGAAALEAVRIAGDDPGLAVGLHLTLSCGTSVLPHEVIPSLVDQKSCFADSPVAAGLKYYFDPRSRVQLEMEIEAQFKAFASTGLSLSHVDGHQHLHAHPAVLPKIIELAVRYGAHGVRVPIDPFWPNLRANRSRLLSKVGVAIGHAYLANTIRGILSRTSLRHCDASIGSLMSGRMDRDYVVRMLRSLDCRAIEIYCHPSLTSTDARGPNTGDLRMLLDGELIEFLQDNEYVLTNYAGIAGERAEAHGHT
jgi:chitin disaccharide deacetylase